jgi:hypothetical protein
MIQTHPKFCIMGRVSDIKTEILLTPNLPPPFPFIERRDSEDMQCVQYAQIWVRMFVITGLV